jgi:hypothetical protein
MSVYITAVQDSVWTSGGGTRVCTVSERVSEHMRKYERV